MRELRRWTPKEKRDEVVLMYLSGDNSVEELGEYYNVNHNQEKTLFFLRENLEDEIIIVPKTQLKSDLDTRIGNKAIKRCIDITPFGVSA